ncbi:LOW QUALITY PROTEIN: G-patch domain and KOW motifs-containing protein [Apus apus]|uniref:LOW QUALITY PROTEIN: G-patch domain and KOW motifs-containing protein n=1 Tax=Apus apus TaxID=8895 RepID=UPI0021F829A6|nr:LOW QUALITY PROTEIN: G-patch domain and KOW motifs-containing protein [Apus apus]
MAASSGPEAAAPGPAGPVSFGFSRKAERRRVLAAGPCAEPGTVGGDGGGDDTDFLTAVEDRELLSTRPAPPPRQELVIPLLPSHRWRNPEPPRGHAPSPSHAPGADHAPDTGSAPAGDPPDGPGSVEAQAVQELLQEVRQSQEQGDHGPPISIPLRLQEKDVIPQAQPGPQDYEAVPVEAFGLAMLRGMGWKQGEGIGRTFKQVVKPLETKLRPRGLGLGADPQPPPGPPKSGEEPPKSRGAPPRGGEKDTEGGGLVVGATVCILAGPHRDMYGKVEGLDPETARAVVRLLLGGQAVTISQHSLRPGTPPPSSHPSRTPKGQGAEEGPDAGVPPQRGAGKRKEPPQTERTPKQPRGAPPKPPPWLRRDLRVRCIDRGVHGGRYYNCKMVIEDLLSSDTCVCRTDDGRLVEGLREAMLETVIPRGEGDRVMVVLGEHAGRVGRILEREPARSRALVQLEREEAGRVVPLDYDAICHYVGGHEDD